MEAEEDASGTTTAAPVNVGAQFATEAATWSQGDVFDLHFSVHVADTRVPLTAVAQQAAAQSNSHGVAILDSAADAVVLVSQTCDVIRAERPTVLVAPVVTLTESEAREASRHQRPRFAPLPALSNVAFADLDYVYPVERSVLSGRKRCAGIDPADAGTFGWAIGRKFSRYAFPDDLVSAIDKLRRRFISKFGNTNSAEGRVMEALEEIRVAANPDWAGGDFDVELVFILKDTALPTLEGPPNPTEWAAKQPLEITSICERILDSRATADDVVWLWNALAERWVELCQQPFGAVQSITSEVTTMSEFSYARLRETEPLDLEHLSVTLDAL